MRLYRKYAIKLSVDNFILCKHCAYVELIRITTHE